VGDADPADRSYAPKEAIEEGGAMTVPIPHHHGPHIHISRGLVAWALVITAAILAAALLVVVERPWNLESLDFSREKAGATATSTGAEWHGRGRGPLAMIQAQRITSSAGAAQHTPAVALPESQAALRHPPASAVAPALASGSGVIVHQLVRGTTLDPPGAYLVQPPAPQYLPGSVANPHPFNVVAGAPH
jgi:hypothetical protein